MSKNMLFILLIGMSIAMFSVSAVVVAKGPGNRLPYVPEVKDIKGNITLFKNNPQNWILSKKDQK